MSSDDRHLLDDAAARARNYLRTLPERRVFPDADALVGLDALDGPFPAETRSATAVIEALDTHASPATVASAGGRYFGFVTGGALPVTLAANWLAGAWDQNAFSATSSPAAARIDAIAARWTLEALRLPSETALAFVTGATMANFTCLAAARGAQLARLGWDVEADGLFAAPALDVVLGAQAHAVIYKALGLLGLGRAQVRVIPSDDQGRLRADALGALGPASIVCLQAGNVNSGAVDPLAEVCERAEAAGAWVHIDGAFGLWAGASARRAQLVAGMEKASSWATDGHKWLNVPYDCGIAMVRDEAALRRALAVSAAYLPESSDREPIDYTPEASRRARGVEVWAALAHLGRAGLADLIDRTCDLAATLAEHLARAGLDIPNEVVLNQVLVRARDDAATESLLARIQADGTCWCGGTTWHGRPAIRLSVSSWATTEADIALTANRIVALARDI